MKLKPIEVMLLIVACIWLLPTYLLVCLLRVLAGKWPLSPNCFVLKACSDECGVSDTTNLICAALWMFLCLADCLFTLILLR